MMHGQKTIKLSFSILAKFAKLRKAGISFTMYVRLSVRME
jgi:hypothetical protein